MLEVLAIGLEVTAGDRRVERGHELGRILVEARLRQRVDVLVDGEVAVPDSGPRDCRDRLRQFEQVER